MTLPHWMTPRRCCVNCPNCRCRSVFGAMTGCGPRQWEVELSGLGPSSPIDCQNCGDLNGIYYLEWVGIDQSGNCVWNYQFPSTICYVAKMNLRVEPGYLSQGKMVWPVSVYLLTAGDYPVFWARKLYTDRLNCQAAVNESLGSLTKLQGVYVCGTTGSNVKITALRPCREPGGGGPEPDQGGFRCPFGPLLPLGR